jgi:hypothetical protein
MKYLGQAITSINLTSTYVALGWSNTAPTMVWIVFYFFSEEKSFLLWFRIIWMLQCIFQEHKSFKIGNEIFLQMTSSICSIDFLVDMLFHQWIVNKIFVLFEQILRITMFMLHSKDSLQPAIRMISVLFPISI